MIRSLVFGVVLAVFASPGWADELTVHVFSKANAQEVSVTFAGTDPTGDVRCVVQLWSNGRMTTTKLVAGVEPPSPAKFIDANGARLALFSGIVDAFRAGTFFPPEARLEGYDPEKSRVPPYLLLGYSERRGGTVSVSYEVVLPGTELPPQMRAMFQSLHDSDCIGG
jgi:hypothetical protein